MVSIEARILFTLLLMYIPITILGRPNTQASFEQLKSLAGQWEGKANGDQTVAVSFRVTAAGTALLSEITGKEDMISMIHMDGPGRLLLMHYCTAGNQPRMLATVSPDGRVFVFDFLDATNLARADDGHMKRVVISIIAANHHTEEWVFVDHGKESKEVFDLHRK
jgi:hypothetical protein